MSGLQRNQDKQIPKLDFGASDAASPFPKGLPGYDSAVDEMKGLFYATGPGKDHRQDSDLGHKIVHDLHIQI